MSEQFANNASSTLNGTIGSGDTSLVVTSALAFPSTGQFRILVETEIMLVTAVSTNTFTITRGYESTVASGHASGTTVANILTAGALAQFQTDTLAIPRSSALYFPMVSGVQTSTSVYSVIGTLPPLTYSALGQGTPTYTFNAFVNIPTSSSAQIRVYDITNHATLYESSIISGQQTEYNFTSTITPAAGSSRIEVWLSSPTNTGGNSTCLSAGLTITYV